MKGASRLPRRGFAAWFSHECGMLRQKVPSFLPQTKRAGRFFCSEFPYDEENRRAFFRESEPANLCRLRAVFVSAAADRHQACRGVSEAGICLNGGLLLVAWVDGNRRGKDGRREKRVFGREKCVRIVTIVFRYEFFAPLRQSVGCSM